MEKKNAFTITRARPEDAAALDYLKIVGGETDNLSFGAEGVPLAPEEEQAYLRTQVDSPDHVQYLARVDGELIGTASLNRKPGRMRHRGVFGISLSQFLYFLTIQFSNAAIGTIMQDLSPVMVLLVACAGAHRKPRAYEIASIVLALLGVTLLTTHGDLTAFAVSPVALIAGVACAVCVTVYNCLCPRRELRDYPVSMLQAWAFLMGAVLFELTMRPWTLGYTPSLRGVGGILFVVLFGNLLAFNLYMTGVKLIGPEKSVLYGFAEPVTAAILAVTLLNTPFTVWDAMGFAAVFAMLAVLSVGGKKYAGRLDV